MSDPLDIEGLTKRFGGITAVDNLSYRCRRATSCHHRPERRR